ncbi:MAG: MTH1187 family thiamine-binding protein [Eubacteriales bacterium]
MAIVEITVVPIGTGSTSVSEYVAKCQKVLEQETNIHYQLTPMGTVIEGDIKVLFEVLQKIHEVPFVEGAQRVATTIKIDDRRDKEGTISQKINSVKEKLK